MSKGKEDYGLRGEWENKSNKNLHRVSQRSTESHRGKSTLVTLGTFHQDSVSKYIL